MVEPPNSRVINLGSYIRVTCPLEDFVKESAGGREIQTCFSREKKDTNLLAWRKSF